MTNHPPPKKRDAKREILQIGETTTISTALHFTPSPPPSSSSSSICVRKPPSPSLCVSIFPLASTLFLSLRRTKLFYSSSLSLTDYALTTHCLFFCCCCCCCCCCCYTSETSPLLSFSYFCIVESAVPKRRGQKSDEAEGRSFFSLYSCSLALFLSHTHTHNTHAHIHRHHHTLHVSIFLLFSFWA